MLMRPGFLRQRCEPTYKELKLIPKDLLKPEDQSCEPTYKELKRL